MTPNIPLAARNVIAEYRRFLKTSYRFLDQGLRRQFETHLETADVVVRGPYVTLARDFERGATLGALAEAGAVAPELLRAAWPFGQGTLFRHQELAFRAGAASRPFVVTSGTGSGKTESFLLPVLDGIVRRKRAGVRGVQAVLLYPMNALANDQLERLRRLLRGSGLDISFGLYTGDSDVANQRLREEPAETERRTRQAIRSDPPDILLTNYKQLEFLLVRKDDRALFTPALRFLVLDEVHSYRGALATEIACLVRRLKAHAGLAAGELVAIATSATVGGDAEGTAALARFASTLFGEGVSAHDIVREELVPFQDDRAPWVPPLPVLSEDDLRALDPSDEASIASLAERLLGRPLGENGSLPSRIRSALEGNRVVSLLESIFSTPTTLDAAANRLRQELGERADTDEEALRSEIEAYLLVGSVGDDDDPPRLRPKLHTFFHGVYDVALCLDPECRTLVPQGGTECMSCGAQARPAALCRTCGQDFVKVRYERKDDDRPAGTGDFYSDESTAFLTHRIHELPEVDGEDEESPSSDSPREERALSPKLAAVGVCTGCGRVLGEGEPCVSCSCPTVRMLQHRGKLNTCPACNDVYTRGDIVTPLRTGTASSTSVLTTHHLDYLAGEDRKLLIFADNRQDVAHQAGYTADKHRSFALRHLVVQELDEAGAEGLHLTELPQRLLDRYRELGIIPQRATTPQRKRWLDALTIEVASEFTRYSRQRASLENLGLIGVDYEFLDLVGADPDLRAAAASAGLELPTAVMLVRAILDIMRKNRAVGFDFFREYVDPVRKRRYRELEEEPYNVRFPDRDRMPKAFAVDRPDHIRRSGRLMGFYQENKKAGQLTAIQKLVVRLVRDRDASERLIKAAVGVLLKDEIGILQRSDVYIPKKERVQGLDAIQIDPGVIRLVAVEKGFRCNACQAWRPYRLPVCPSSRCRDGVLQPSSADGDNYYVGLYRERPPRRLAVAEHSAQISGEDRAKRETEFKQGRLDVLVCSPTLELGVDIGPLLTVVLRNAPPTPTNYVQRVGRAGRRLRIGFASTFCAGGHHDRHAFEEPEWLVAGRFDPPTLRLDNPHIVRRHLHSHVLESLHAEIPARMGELLDNLRTPTSWRPELLAPVFDEVRSREPQLVGKLAALFDRDRALGRMSGFDADGAREVVRDFEASLSSCLEGWWRRVSQLDKEFREFSTVGSPRQDERKAAARKRAYYELTQDPERSYSLNYLSMQGLLPAYQFPVDTFSLDPGVADAQTIYRPASIAIEEFAPGNYVYANGRKLRSIRVLFSGGPGAAGQGLARSDAEAAGRLQSFHFCESCEEVVEAPRSQCPRCNSDLPTAVNAVFVEAFEAEEALRIGSDEESRQRQFHVRRESLLPGAVQTTLYPYPLVPVEHGRMATVLVTNWGRAEAKTGEPARFWLCPDCGRHLPHEMTDTAKDKQVRAWLEQHTRHCSGQLARLILGYRFETDSLTITTPTRSDAAPRGRARFSPTLVTLAEALLAGAATLLEIEPYEIHAFVRSAPQGSAGDQIVFYETVPGGAGYVEQVARRLPEVARAAQRRVYGHRCSKACYLCLKHYRNQRWHPFFDKDAVRDLLVILANLDPVEPTPAQAGAGLDALRGMLTEREAEMGSGGAVDPATGRYRKGAIEEPLRAALDRVGRVPAGDREYEVRDDAGQLVTVPDFAWENAKVAVYCDGYAFHGDRETLELDARKRNFLQSRGWVVLTYWGRTILRDPDACAEQIVEVYRQRLRADA
jgi:hypothetical protein